MVGQLDHERGDKRCPCRPLAGPQAAALPSRCFRSPCHSHCLPLLLLCLLDRLVQLVPAATDPGQQGRWLGSVGWHNQQGSGPGAADDAACPGCAARACFRPLAAAATPDRAPLLRSPPPPTHTHTQNHSLVLGVLNQAADGRRGIRHNKHQVHSLQLIFKVCVRQSIRCMGQGPGAPRQAAGARAGAGAHLRTGHGPRLGGAHHAQRALVLAQHSDLRRPVVARGG